MNVLSVHTHTGAAGQGSNDILANLKGSTQPWTEHYTNSSGDLTAVGLGASGTALVSNGTAAAPTMQEVVRANQVVRKLKPANETVTNSTVRQNDDDLFWSVKPGSWLLAYHLQTGGASAGDISIGFAGGSTTWRLQLQGFGLSSDAGNSTGSRKSIPVTLTSPGRFGVFNTPSLVDVVDLVGSIVATVSGTLNLQWAQGTADATGVTIYTDSWLRAERIG